MSDNRVADYAALCDSLVELRDKHATLDVPPTVDADAIIGALHQFQECVRYLNTRRSSGAILNLASEADVQDAVYLMLRPWVHDLVSENPGDKVANRFAIKDFISRAAKTVIEVKYVRDEQHGKRISSEMHDDIENYRHHPHCKTIVFFLYDPNSLIPDEQSLREQIEEDRLYSGKALRCVLVLKP